MASGLTAEQIDFFNREGYLVAENIFTPEDLEPLRDEITSLIHKEALRLQSEGKLDNLHEDKPFETRLTHLYRDHPDLVESDILLAITGRAGGGHSGPALFDTITHPSLLATVESLVGPEIVGSSVYRIRPKIPGLVKGVVPWHQDSGYFRSHCDQDLIVTCWIPLVDATPENGCLQVLPRTHTEGVFTHHTGGSGGFLVITDDDLPSNEIITTPVPLGGALLLTNRTPHCSTDNITDVVRWSIDLRYQSADVPNNVGELPEDFELNRPPEEIACYPPEADFIVQSPKNPNVEIKRWEDFDALRQRYEANRPPYQGRWQSLDV